MRKYSEIGTVVSILWFAGFLFAGEPALPERTETKKADLTRAIAELGSDDFETREKGSKELDKAGAAALPELKAAMQAAKDVEVANRLKNIIEKLDRDLKLAKLYEGLIELPSGLKYKVLTEGKGEKPQINDTVKCHYTGKFQDGKIFDSSRQRGEAASFPLKAVIAGWTEALQLMKTGSTWVLIIPPKLAYGEEGIAGTIPRNATLIFEVELIEINK
jgi:FKBP-type peptidyl-prolyl cis-trans isomerase